MYHSPFLPDGQQSQGAQLVGSDLTSLPSNPPTPVHRPSSASVASGTGSLCSANLVDKDYAGLDFKIIWDCKTGPAKTIHLVAPSMQEKTAWVSDISQVNWARAKVCCSTLSSDIDTHSWRWWSCNHRDESPKRELSLEFYREFSPLATVAVEGQTKSNSCAVLLRAFASKADRYKSWST